jgi:SAM-dependent methyltransferase
MTACPICGAALPSPVLAAPDRGQGTPGTFEVAVCAGCGAGVTLPLARPDELAAFYPSGYGPHHGVERGLLGAVSRVIRWLQARVAWRRPPLAALSALAPPGRGVDVGAGRGDLAATLAARGWRMTAIEPAAGAVAHIRARGLDAREGVLGTVELDPQSYDFAVFQHSLEHTPDPLGDLRVIRAALRPGGIVLISVPNFSSWQRRVFADAWYHLDLPRHRTHFTQAALDRALAAAGFDDARFARSSSAVGLPASVQYRFAGRCLFPDGLALRVATGLCALSLPVSRLLDRVAGEGDTLHAVARRPDH